MSSTAPALSLSLPRPRSTPLPSPLRLWVPPLGALRTLALALLTASPPWTSSCLRRFDLGTIGPPRTLLCCRRRTAALLLLARLTLSTLAWLCLTVLSPGALDLRCPFCGRHHLSCIPPLLALALPADPGSPSRLLGAPRWTPQADASLSSASWCSRLEPSGATLFALLAEFASCQAPGFALPRRVSPRWFFLPRRLAAESDCS